jgi:hypothetical protein
MQACLMKKWQQNYFTPERNVCVERHTGRESQVLQIITSPIDHIPKKNNVL